MTSLEIRNAITFEAVVGMIVACQKPQLDSQFDQATLVNIAVG